VAELTEKTWPVFGFCVVVMAVGMGLEYFGHSYGLWVGVAGFGLMILAWIAIRMHYVQLANERDRHLGKPLPLNASYWHMKHLFDVSMLAAFVIWVPALLLTENLLLSIIITIFLWIIFAGLYGKYREARLREDDLRYDR
jgi:hypothetical protein